MSLFRELGDRYAESRTLNNLGCGAYSRGDYDEAATSLRASLAISEEIGNRALAALSLSNLALVSAARGDFAAADDFLRASVRGFRDLRATPFLLSAIVAFAEVRALQGDHVGAVALVALIREQPGANAQTHRCGRDLLDRIAAHLPPDHLAAAVERGRHLDLEAVIGAIVAGTYRHFAAGTARDRVAQDN